MNIIVSVEKLEICHLW